MSEVWLNLRRRESPFLHHTDLLMMKGTFIWISLNFRAFWRIFVLFKKWKCVNPLTYNISVHKVEEGSGKIFSTAEVIHDIEKQANLSKIMELLINIQNDAVLYVPSKNLIWLWKGSKQPVSLKTHQDLETCKKEYGTGSIRIACEVVMSEVQVWWTLCMRYPDFIMAHE